MRHEPAATGTTARTRRKTPTRPLGLGVWLTDNASLRHDKSFEDSNKENLLTLLHMDDRTAAPPHAGLIEVWMEPCGIGRRARRGELAAASEASMHGLLKAADGTGHLLILWSAAASPPSASALASEIDHSEGHVIWLGPPRPLIGRGERSAGLSSVDGPADGCVVPSDRADRPPTLGASLWCARPGKGVGARVGTVLVVENCGGRRLGQLTNLHTHMCIEEVRRTERARASPRPAGAISGAPDRPRRASPRHRAARG